MKGEAAHPSEIGPLIKLQGYEMITIDMTWGTHRELEFVRKLGSHCEPKIKMKRESLLNNYIKSLDKRTRFDFDIDVVAEVAQKELEKEQLKMKVIK